MIKKKSGYDIYSFESPDIETHQVLCTQYTLILNILFPRQCGSETYLCNLSCEEYMGHSIKHFREANEY